MADLIVDDAVRGELVRDLYSLPMVLALVAVFSAYAATGPVGRPLTGSLDLGLAAVAGAVTLSGLAMTLWMQFPGRTTRAAAV